MKNKFLPFLLFTLFMGSKAFAILVTIDSEFSAVGTSVYSNGYTSSSDPSSDGQRITGPGIFETSVSSTSESGEASAYGGAVFINGSTSAILSGAGTLYAQGTPNTARTSFGVSFRFTLAETVNYSLSSAIGATLFSNDPEYAKLIDNWAYRGSTVSIINRLYSVPAIDDSDVYYLDYDDIGVAQLTNVVVAADNSASNPMSYNQYHTGSLTGVLDPGSYHLFLNYGIWGGTGGSGIAGFSFTLASHDGGSNSVPDTGSTLAMLGIAVLGMLGGGKILRNCRA